MLRVASFSSADQLQQNADDYINLFETITNQNNFDLRNDIFDPGARFAKHAFGDQTWNREIVVSQAIRYFNQAHSARSGILEDIGICATLASRGCGKSHIVDVLCRLRDHPELFPDLAKVLVPVCISFNGPQDYKPGIFPDSESNVIARLVHRGFFDSNDVTWTRFCHVTRHVKWNDFELDVLMEAMITFFKQIQKTCTRAKASEPVVLIAVDEVSVCGKQTAPAILDILKTLITNNPSQCRLLVTTFDDLYLVDDRDENTGSNRPIDWLVLTPLLEEHREEFKKTQLRKAQLKNAQQDYFVSLSGGHPRSLALLKAEFDYTHSYTFADILKGWQKRFSSFNSKVPEDNVVKDLLARTILHQKIRVEDCIHQIPVKELIRQTFILNSMDPKVSFVPQLSPLFLRFWSDPDNYAERTPLKMQVKRLLDLGEDLDWVKFEEFNLIFEDLRCWAWHELNQSSKKPCVTQTIGSWFAGGEFLCGDETTVLNIHNPKVCGVWWCGSVVWCVVWHVYTTAFCYCGST